MIHHKEANKLGKCLQYKFSGIVQISTSFFRMKSNGDERDEFSGGA